MAQEGFLGEIRIFAGNFAPRSWALCEGQLLPIAQNTALFSILGTIYGGDGRTTFALPDLRGRVPISSGTGPGLPTYREGSRSGQATHVLNLMELPSHNHNTQSTMAGNITIGTSSEGPDTATANGALLSNTSGNVVYNEEDVNGKLTGVQHNLIPQVAVEPNGGTQSHNNMQPYLSINHIIAIQGTFPSRS